MLRRVPRGHDKLHDAHVRGLWDGRGRRAHGGRGLRHGVRGPRQLPPLRPDSLNFGEAPGLCTSCAYLLSKDISDGLTSYTNSSTFGWFGCDIGALATNGEWVASMLTGHCPSVNDQASPGVWIFSVKIKNSAYSQVFKVTCRHPPQVV